MEREESQLEPFPELYHEIGQKYVPTYPGSNC